MATEPTPTDAEIDALIAQHWPAFATAGAIPLTWLRNAFREGLARWGAQPAPAASPVPLTDEQQRAIFEAYESAASESYFEVRPHIDYRDRRRVFKAGYERGWDAARKQGANHD